MSGRRIWWHVHTTNPDYCHGGSDQREVAEDYLETIRDAFDHPDAVLVAGFEPISCPHGAHLPRIVLQGRVVDESEESA